MLFKTISRVFQTIRMYTVVVLASGSFVLITFLLSEGHVHQQDVTFLGPACTPTTVEIETPETAVLLQSGMLIL